MKIWVINKRTGIILALLLVILISAICFSRNEAVTVAGTKRDLPVYCVDTGEEKVISISFDAAWGNGIYGRCNIRHWLFRQLSLEIYI